MNDIIEFSAHKIPQDTLDSIRAYVLDGLPPGGFLEAVLENNLTESFGRADSRNFAAMPHIAWYMYEIVPLSCRGSREIVSSWIETGGLIGNPAREVVKARMDRAELEGK